MSVRSVLPEGKFQIFYIIRDCDICSASYLDSGIIDRVRYILREEEFFLHLFH